jgi:acyl carrier protein
MVEKAVAAADAGRIDRWLAIYLAVLVGKPSGAIDRDMPLSRFDIDSVDAVQMALEFERAFNCQVGPELFLGGGQSIREMVPVLLTLAEKGHG